MRFNELSKFGQLGSNKDLNLGTVNPAPTDLTLFVHTNIDS